ncbi:MAG: inositol monophosphatase family protein [Parcubacteria group bacterium]
MTNNENNLRQTAIKAAKEAGRFLMENIDNVKSDEIQYDVHANPTTKIDRASEQKIVEIIKVSFPKHAFLGEELGKSVLISEYKWIIDPIDGTNNYIAKRNTFSVSIGLEYKGEIILGVIYLPKTDEMFVAEKGKGATLNNEPIHTSKAYDLSKAIITYSTYPGSEDDEIGGLDKRIMNSIPNVKYFGFYDSTHIVDETFGKGGMAAEFCYLACGRIDGLIRLKQKPWDVAAGSLIAAEAGAIMTNLDGKECDVYEGDYVAGNAKIVKQLLGIVKK